MLLRCRVTSVPILLSREFHLVVKYVKYIVQNSNKKWITIIAIIYTNRLSLLPIFIY